MSETDWEPIRLEVVVSVSETVVVSLEVPSLATVTLTGTTAPTVALEGASIAVRPDGTVQAWGSDGSIANVPSGLNNVVSVSAGWHHALALKADGTLVAWGDNSAGQCDIPTDITSVTMKPLKPVELSVTDLIGSPSKATSIFALNGRSMSSVNRKDAGASAWTVIINGHAPARQTSLSIQHP